VGFLAEEYRSMGRESLGGRGLLLREGKTRAQYRTSPWGLGEGLGKFRNSGERETSSGFALCVDQTAAGQPEERGGGR